MAAHYAKSYDLIDFAGSDNHVGAKQTRFAGMCSEKAISNEKDFIEAVKNGEMTTFTLDISDEK